MTRHVVIVGYGMAGARLAEEIRRRDPDGSAVRLTVLGAESHPAYNRVLLSAVLAGGMSVESVRLHDTAWAARHRVEVRTATQVVGVDRRARTVRLDDDSVLGYDALVLATGSRAWIPPTEGLSTADGSPAEGVATFRDLDDCHRIMALARDPEAHVAVLGGGLLGLEAARGLAGRGLRVTVLHPVGHLMERQLDAGAGRVLAATLGALGITVRLDVKATRWTPGLLDCADGSTVDCAAVVVSAGVRAQTWLARAAGLAVEQGVLVDDRMATSDPWISAIGDCAQHPGTISGLVASAWEQAAVLADLLTAADEGARYRGTPTVTRLKARDIDLAALGEVHSTDGDGAEVLHFSDPARGRYAKLVLRDERVTGAILLGAPDAAARIVQLYDRGAPAPSDRLALLLGRALPAEAEPVTSPALLPARAVVCRCSTVTKGQLVTAWRAGARQVESLARATRAGTGCGSCRDAVSGICAWLAAGDPMPPVDEMRSSNGIRASDEEGAA